MVNVQANRLVITEDRLVGEAQKCTLLTKIIHENLHLIRFVIDMMDNAVDNDWIRIS